METLQDVGCQIDCANRQVYIDRKIIPFGWLEQDPNTAAGEVRIAEKIRIPKETGVRTAVKINRPLDNEVLMTGMKTVPGIQVPDGCLFVQ